jgi:hypothetical protein
MTIFSSNFFCLKFHAIYRFIFSLSMFSRLKNSVTALLHSYSALIQILVSAACPLPQCSPLFKYKTIKRMQLILVIANRITLHSRKSFYFLSINVIRSYVENSPLEVFFNFSNLRLYSKNSLTLKEWRFNLSFP